MTSPTIQTQKRREDLRLITGHGRYTADNRPDGLLHLVFVRCPHAHARIVRIDTTAAGAADGVVAVITAADLIAGGLQPFIGGVRYPHPDGKPSWHSPHHALLEDRVRFVGEAVAAVVATTCAGALSAAELVEVEYADLPAVVGLEAAQPGAPVVWDEAPDNIAFLWQAGDASATESALASASHVVHATLRVSRVAVNPMETRNTMAVPQPDGRIVVHASHQSPHSLRDALEKLGFEPGSLSVQIGDVGGSFGLKSTASPEAACVVFAARLLGRPVIWESTRTEAFLSDDHARELSAETEIGFDADRRIVGLRMRVHGNVGAYLSGRSTWMINNMGGIAGVYDIPAIHAQVLGVFSHSSPTAAYRGAGRPEATFLIERLLDIAARELGVSPIELRRRNLIPPSAMPYRTALTFTYDCGEFEENMRAALAMADIDGFPARREEAATRGKLRGFGLANCIEAAGGPFVGPQPDTARVSLMSDGRLRVESGSMSVGQGHETVMPQLVADRFGVPAEQIDYVLGNTDLLPQGRGSGGSSGMCVGAAAILQSSDHLIAELTEIAARELDTPPDALTFEQGLFRSRDANRTLSLAEVAAAAVPVEQGVAASKISTYRPAAVTFPNGTHICEVEIDPETGMVEVVSYNAVEDIGRVLHPMLAEGQIQGGVAQGIGQALGELLAYDEAGQLLTASFMDYQMPRAGDLPNYRLAFREVLTKVNALGVKGVGEAGTVGALAASVNAVNDALAPLGVRDLGMPASPQRVWAAIQGAKRQT